MPYDKNEPEYSGGPKKADIIIKNTRDIADRQEELNEQTKLVVSRIDEAIDLFNKNNQDSSYVVKQSGEIFTQLQGENSALKQELLYLAKQSENIYAGLAEKITELSEQAKTREDAMTGFADKLNDVAEQTRKGEENYSIIVDKLTQLAEQNKRNEELYTQLLAKLDGVQPSTTTVVQPTETVVKPVVEVDLTSVMDKLDAVSEQLRRNERAYSVLSDKVDEKTAGVSPSGIDLSQVNDKLTRIAEQMRRGENAHSMLADKFEILSMRVEQYAYDRSQPAYDRSQPAYAHPQPQVTTVAYPAPPVQQTAPKEEIDYDKLAEKIAALISTREAVSPDYIASKVAEQIIIPEVDIPGLNLSVDADYIASRVAERIVIPEPEPASFNVTVDTDEIAKQVADLVNEYNKNTEVIDEDGLADKIAERVSALNPAEEAVPSAEIDEDGLADKIAARLNELRPAEEIVPVHDIDEDGLADKVAQRLAELKPAAEELAPASAVNLDEERLADYLAQRMGGVGMGVYAPVTPVANVNINEDELAEKIAQKIGGMNTGYNPAPVADIDEEELADAISLKVGSLKAEDFEILVDDEGCSSISKGIADNLDYDFISGVVADKLREALDLAAVNAPDYEDMAERISEKITVAGINEDAIADKAAAVLSNYLPEFDTDEITDKITGAVIDVVSAMPQPTIDGESICNTITERLIESQEDHDYDIVIDDDGISKITELVSEEIERETGARFDKVEEDIAKLSELLSKVDEYVRPEEIEEEETEDDYDKLSEIVASEVEKNTAERFDKVEEGIAKLCELMTAEETEDEQAEEQTYEDEYEEYVEEDYAMLSEVVAAEIEKGVSTRLASVEENIAKLTEYITSADGEEEAEEEITDEEVSDEETYEEAEEEDYAALSEAVAAEVEKRVSACLASVEENIARIADSISADKDEEELSELDAVSEDEEAEEEIAEEDYAVLSEAVASEVEKRVAYRLDSLEESVAKIREAITAGEEADGYEEEIVEEDYTALSEVVAAEIEKGVSARLDSLEENVAKITEIITAEPEEEYGEEYEEEEEAEEDYTVLSEAVAAEVEKRVAYRLDSVEESIAKITELVQSADSGEAVTSEGVASSLSLIVTAAIQKGVADRFDGVEQSLANITEILTAEEDVGEYEEYEVLNEDGDVAGISEAVAAEVEKRVASRLDSLEENVAKIHEAISSGDEGFEDEYEEVVEEDYTALSEAVATEVEKRVSERLTAEIKQMLENGVIVTNAATEVAAAEAQPVVEEELVEEEDIPLVTVSDIVEPVAEEEPEVKEASDEQFEEDEEEKDDDDDFLIDVLDMDAFSDNELMPGELSEYGEGVDFENMMKFKRSFIARIIQSADDCKQYYGEVKHALLSYRKVNSNVAWGAERFNKGRETIARMKIRGKTLCLYLALDPNEYKTSVYHHLDVSDNKSVAGTPMMVKVKSPLGVRKAIRLIDEMLAKRNGEKREIHERDYAAMYPYETIEELIEDGLVKDVRNK